MRPVFFLNKEIYISNLDEFYTDVGLKYLL